MVGAVLSGPVNLGSGAVLAQRYVLEERLSSGFGSSVYKARAPGGHVAIKVLHEQIAHNAVFRAKFRQEIEIGKRLSSPNAVRILDDGVDPATGLVFFVMELLDGRTLAEVVEGSGARTIPEALTILRHVCLALAEAHALGVVHRDLKPTNVVWTESGVCKVLDFGIAKVLADWQESAGTVVMGSSGWPSPEQLRGESVDPRSDVWSIGLLTFYLLSGKMYWLTAAGDAPSAAAVQMEILTGLIEPPSARAVALGAVPSWPPKFDAWFAHCVARERDVRFMDAAAAYAALETSLMPSTKKTIIHKRQTPAPPRVSASLGAGVTTTPGTPQRRIITKRTVTLAPGLPREPYHRVAELVETASDELRDRLKRALTDWARGSLPQVGRAAGPQAQAAGVTPIPGAPMFTPTPGRISIHKRPGGTQPPISLSPNSGAHAAVPPTPHHSPRPPAAGVHVPPGAMQAMPTAVPVRASTARRDWFVIAALIICAIASVLYNLGSLGVLGSRGAEEPTRLVATARLLAPPPAPAAPSSAPVSPPPARAKVALQPLIPAPARPETLATDGPCKNCRIILSGGALYWAASTGGAVRVKRGLRGVVETIVAGESAVGSLSVDATHAYWLSSTGAMRRAPIQGGAAEEFVRPQRSVHDILAVGGSVGWTESGGDVVIAHEGDLSRVALGGARPLDLAHGAGCFFWTESEGRVRRACVNTSTEAEIVAESMPGVHGIAYADPCLYVTQSASEVNDGAVVRIDWPLRGTTVLAANRAVSWGIVAIKGWVYWTEPSNGTVLRVKATGGPVETLATGQSQPTAITSDGRHVAWMNEQTGEVTRLALRAEPL